MKPFFDEYNRLFNEWWEVEAWKAIIERAKIRKLRDKRKAVQQRIDEVRKKYGFNLLKTGLA